MFPIFGVWVERWGDIHRQKLVALFVPENVHQRFIEIEETALRCRYEDAFLDILEEHAELILGLAAFGKVFQHVNRAKRNTVRIVKRGIGDKKVSAECRVNLLGVSCGTFAVGTGCPMDLRLLQKSSKRLAFKLSWLHAKMPSQSAVRSQYRSGGRVHHDQIANRIEGVEPLPAGIRCDLEQRNVLDGETEKVGNVDKKIFFITSEGTRCGGTDSQKSERLLFPGDANEDERRQFFVAHPIADARVRCSVEDDKRCLLLEHRLSPKHTRR